ncbi:hypothetical protein [Roseateles sp. P5_E1]
MELLSVSADAIDAHPLIREYFGALLKREQPEAFQAAHSRLFDYLCENTPHRPDGLDGLAPLYEAPPTAAAPDDSKRRLGRSDGPCVEDLLRKFRK